MYYIVTELERKAYGYDSIEEAIEDAEQKFPRLSWEIRDEYEEVVYTHYIDEESEEDKPMRSISIDNGNTYVTPAEAIAEMDWDVIVSMMDDEIREAVHADMAPCTEEEFLTEYLHRADEDLIIG